MLSDQELLQHGQSHGFAILYKRYSDTLYRFALMVSGSRSIAEEATQETFVYMIENSSAFDATRNSSAIYWLYGVLRNRVKALSREDSRRPVEVLLNDRSPSPEHHIALAGAAADIATAIEKLSFEQREVIVLCGLQEVDYVSAAAILKIPVGTVRSRLYRARKNLLRALPKPFDMSTENLGYEL